MTIEFQKTDSGFRVKVPFTLKDSFKANFPSAKWDGTYKQWLVGPRAEPKLLQFVEAMKSQVEKMEALDADIESREMSLQELNKYQKDLDDQITRHTQKLEELERSIANFEEVKRPRLQAALEHLEQMKATIAEKAHIATMQKYELREQLDEIKDRVAKLVSIDAMESIFDTLDRYCGEISPAKKTLFDEAQGNLIQMKRKLTEVRFGWKKLDWYTEMNRNRRDRDHGSLMPKGHEDNFYVRPEDEGGDK